MKKILILILTFSTFKVPAQEKQNDATWEETVAFLNDNIKYLNSTHVNDKLVYTVENNNKIRLSLTDKGGINYTFRIALRDIKNVKYFKGNTSVYAYGNVIEGISNNVFPLRYNSNIESISKMGERITKALKQIAYYNHQRNKKSKF